VTISPEKQLISAGMSESETAAKLILFSAVRDALNRLDPAASGNPTGFFVPGRIEVLGKHTDYAGGRSLLAAVERGFCVVARGRSDSEVRVVDARSGERASFALSDEPGSRSEPWTVYVLAVIRRLARNFPWARRGADIAFASDLPAAAGLSSSSALMIAVFLALCEANSLGQSSTYRENIQSTEDLAGYLASIEAGQDFGALAGDAGVGTFGGSEDHTAILCCQAGHLSQYSFCPVRSEGLIALAPSVIFAIAISGVVAEKTGAALQHYNNTSAASRVILDLWRKKTGRTDISLAAAASSPVAQAQIRGMISESHLDDFSAQTLLDRFDQFIGETTVIVPQAAAAIERADWDILGALVDRSQSAAESLLGNQVPETIALARLGRECGAIAASSFGAGFGGSVWALVHTASAERFLHDWEDRYRSFFSEPGGKASFFVTRSGPAALRIDLSV
jgi:galactokinase